MADSALSRRQLLRLSTTAGVAALPGAALAAQGTGHTPEAQALARKMATARANFARTGNPGQPGLPWAPFNPDRCPTMIFDNVCRMADDPDGEARKIVSATTT